MRFTQQDTHWNTSNMIYGDNPQKINEREDKLGLKTYSYVPQISAVVQIGNLYVYAVGNPVMYADEDGEMALFVATMLVGIAVGGIIGAVTSYCNTGKVNWKSVAIGAAAGGIAGAVGGAAASLIASSAMGGTSIALSGAQTLAGLSALIKGGESASLWGVSRDGINQGIRHYFEYSTKYPERLSQIAKILGVDSFTYDKTGFNNFTKSVMNIVNNYQSIGAMMRSIGNKTVYYYNKLIIIMFDGKLQSVMVGSQKYFQNMK